MKNIHLIISSLIVLPLGFIYGFQPNLLFDVTINSIDEANIFKAVMGLYLGFSTLWIIGLLKPAFWKTATMSNMIFMLGLAFGRILSMFYDGIPSTIFVIGTIGELVLGLYALYQLQLNRASKKAL
ncbi:DUF4345 domain-containing protein [Flavobacterium paronense]|uniref:DUF4345 domain-containing protein n=1 Tax=Flavobacterium paronense TaxID=1392775 RepID=A0ABV5GCV9_9FLAO|nr:DUF4345 domain-containing protein [Flavobacterium paronense]MDN3676259.1 DUF4345 domain-containing protein [Flavobacterium paronense]